MARGGDPAPTPLHNRFIAAGRRAERRRLRVTATAALVAVAVTLAFAGAAVLQWRRAEVEAEAARRQTAIAEAQLAATRSTTAGTVWAALAFAVEAELRTPEPLPEARSVLAAAMQRLARQPARPLGLMPVPNISSAAWSPSEPRLVTTADGAAQLWDVPGRIPLGAPKKIMDSFEMIAWSPAGQLLAAAGDDDLDDVVKLFTVADDSPPVTIYRDMPGLVTALTSSPDGSRLAIGGGAGVQLFDVASGRLDATPLIPVDQPESLTWSPDGGLLALLSADGVQLYDAASGAPVGPPLADRGAEVTSLAWSPTGSRLAGLTVDRTVRLWDVPQPSAQPTPARGYAGTFGSMRWSPDGSTIASIEFAGELRLWDGATGAPIGDPVPSNSVQLQDLGWSADGTVLAARGLDATVRLWTPSTARPLRLLDKETVTSLAFSPAGDRLATTGKNGTAQVFDTRTGAAVGPPIAPVPGPARNAVAWSARGVRLARASGLGPVQLWDAGSGAPVLTMAGSEGGALDLAWSPDGSRLAAVLIGGILRIWDPATGQPILDLQPDPAAAHLISRIAWSPDGRRLATVAETVLRTWDAHTGQPLSGLLEGHDAQVRAASWSPDSTRLASSGLDATMRRWDAASGAALGPPSAIRDRAGAAWVADVAAVAWSPSGMEIATGDSDGTIRLWSAATGAPVGDPLDTGRYVQALAWSPDGRRLAASGGSGVLLWESVPERQACRWALDALAADGLRAIAGPAAPPLRCTDPDSVTDLAPLPLLPQLAPQPAR